jgi:hypothetical protein
MTISTFSVLNFFYTICAEVNFTFVAEEERLIGALVIDFTGGSCYVCFSFHDISTFKAKERINISVINYFSQCPFQILTF